MKITQEVREFADNQGIDGQSALSEGMKAKAIEFKKLGSNIYNKN